MGGFTSGRLRKNPVVEEGFKIDLRHLRQIGLFAPGSTVKNHILAWQNTSTGEKAGSVGIEYQAAQGRGWFRLRYTYTTGHQEPREIESVFVLEAFPQPFSGRRWYFRCPTTGRRCQCLYQPDGEAHFRSRQAFKQKLQYASQTDSNYQRTMRRYRKLGEQLDRRRVNGKCSIGRPKGMHHRTYARMTEKLSDELFLADRQYGELVKYATAREQKLLAKM